MKLEDEQREQARLDFLNRPPFDPDLQRKNFRQSFRNLIKVLKEKLPENIINKVADIRVLALGYASSEVKKEIIEYCKENEKKTRLAVNSYKKQFKKQFGINAPAFAMKLNLHDCTVQSCRRVGKDVLLTLDNSLSFTNISKIRLKNCEVIKQDSRLYGAWCLYEEIYKVRNRFEIHFLMHKKGLIDFIVLVDDLEF